MGNLRDCLHGHRLGDCAHCDIQEMELVIEQQDRTLERYGARVSELEQINSVLVRRINRDALEIAELEGAIKCLEETAAENSRVHVELHNTIQALNKENANLAKQLFRFENPD